MAWVYGSRVKERRWWKTNALWWVYAPAFMVTWFTSTSNLSFLWMGMIWRTTRFNWSAVFWCPTMFISSGMLMVWAPTFWMGMILMLPNSFHSPAISFMFPLRILLVCAAPSSHGNWMLMTLWRTFMVLLPGWWVWFYLGTIRSYLGTRRKG